MNGKQSIFQKNFHFSSKKVPRRRSTKKDLIGIEHFDSDSPERKSKSSDSDDEDRPTLSIPNDTIDSENEMIVKPNRKLEASPVVSDDDDDGEPSPPVIIKQTRKFSVVEDDDEETLPLVIIKQSRKLDSSPIVSDDDEDNLTKPPVKKARRHLVSSSDEEN